MRCCVPFCNSTSRNATKSQGITFHMFPTEPRLHAAWLKALSKEEGNLPDRAAVCSQHFMYDDFYETKNGTKKIKTGAVPFVVKVCMICLDTDGKLYLLSKYKLEEAYKNLTGLSLSDKVVIPQTLCVECAQRLLNCSRFRDKSLRAHTLMLELAEKHNFITPQNIKSINRESNQLLSNIVQNSFEPDHYNLYLLHEEKQTELEKVDNFEVSVTVKNESDDDFYMNDNLAEPKEETEVNGVNNDIDNDNDNDADFVVPNRDYSTDDSLPLETKRKKLKKEKTKKTTVKKLAKNANEPKIDRRRKPLLNSDLNETLFTIADLSFEEQVAEIQKRQESSNYKNSTFKCTVCFKGFLDEEAYNGHMTRHTTQCGEYECDICKTHFKHSHALRKHITAHHTQRFSCNSCTYVTTHRQTARLHERWHKGTKYQCPHCPDEFVKFTTYMGHVRIKHPSDFVCALCGYSFVSEKGLDLHKKLKHRLGDWEIPDDGPLCERCNVRFVSDAAYKKHLQVSAKHTIDSDSNERNKSQSRPREMKGKPRANGRKQYPSQLRKAEGPIPCEQCGMQLEDSRAYHGHFRRHHPDKNRTNYPSMKTPCMCETCGKMFQSYALLKDHRWVHTGERPFACDACGKSFRMKQRLVAHRRVHSQERASYVCSLCGKSFSTHSNRQRHMVIHTGLKPFKCEMCGKCFKHSSEKRAHVTYVHLKKPWPKRARAKRRCDRTGQLQSQGSLPPGVSEMDIGQPVWGSCDPKMSNMSMMDDKPLYYSNLKI